MKGFVCPEHGGFPTKVELMSHMKEDHGVSPDVIQGIDAVPEPLAQSGKIRQNLDLNPASPTPIMNPDLIARMQELRKAETQPVPGKIEEEKKEDKPLRLEYRWSGTCPECHSEVSTIMLGAGKRSYAVCYCGKCDKQLLNRIVEPLKEVSRL